MPSRDWRSSSDYDYLDDASLRDIAWEYLRRNRDYAAEYNELDATELTGDAGRSSRWGLRFRGGPKARLAICEDFLTAGSRSRCGVVRLVARELYRRANRR